MVGNQWTRVAQESDLKEGEPLGVEIDGTAVVLVRLPDGNLSACGGECPHHGAPLADGLLLGDRLVCPWHHARFEMASGRMEAAPALDDLGCWAVKVEDGEVYVRPRQRLAPQRSSKQETDTIAILGAGAAGQSCAETLRREGFAGTVLLIGGEPDRPYDRTDLSKAFMAGGKEEADLYLRDEGFYGEHGITLRLGERVASISPGARELVLEGGERVRYTHAVIATGGVPRRLPVPGADLEGVFLLRSLEGARSLMAALEVDGPVVVIGAGFIGLEVAASLRSRDREVHVVAPEDVPMVPVFGERVGRMLAAMHEEGGTHLHLRTKVEEIRGDGAVEDIVLSDGTRLAARMVIAGLGIDPATQFLADTGLLADDGGVPVDGILRADAPGLYAAGDVAAVPDPRTGTRRRIEHWTEAERQGAHVARAILGEERDYAEMPFFWTRQFGTSLAYIGYVDKPDRIAYRGSVEGQDFAAGYYADGRLMAVAAAGRSRLSIALGGLLHAGGNLGAEEFQDESVDVAAILDRIAVKEATGAP